MTWKALSLGLVLALAACQPEADSAEARAQQRSNSLPSSNGTHNELTLFCDRDLWEGGLGLTLIESLAEPMAGLPQAEPHFDLSRIDQKAVTSLTKRSKSILTLAVIPDSSATLVIRDLWASPQLVIAIIAPSADELEQRVRASLPEVIAKFDEHDARVLASRIKSSQSAVVPASLQELGVKSLTLAKGFKTTLNGEGMAVLREDTRKSIQYLLAWEAPWDGEYDPSQALLGDLDSLLNAYFEGLQDGSYLAVEPQIPVIQSYRQQDNRLTYVSRGLFRTQKGFGGGPFLLYSYTDEKNNRVVNLCYLVYGPSMKKRKVMMELETSLQSVILKP